MFIDEAHIYVEGGRGGDGCVSSRHEPHRPKGGPDGGDGGAGGDVVLEVTPGRSTLAEYHRRRHFKASSGRRGGGNNRKGARGADLVIPVPEGTVVSDGEGRTLCDLLAGGQRFVAAAGGRGGRGNASLVREAGPMPRFAEKGEPGKARDLDLELRLVADVAVVGFPNAGKSSLISRISRARPRIADYPFTTTEPNLGVVVGEDSDFVVTDVPGLVPGAHLGRGMGIAFLRHIERASTLVFLVDMSPMSGRRPVDDLVGLEEELGAYNPALLERARLVAANKMDLSPPPEEMEALAEACGQRGLELYPVSVVTGEGMPALLGAMWRMVESARRLGATPAVPVEFVEAEPEIMSVAREGERFVVTGPAPERAVQMTDWENDDARTYLAGRLRRMGVEDALARAGAVEGDEVEIAGRVFEYVPEPREEETGSENG
ncbi:MAG: GTPase ObgE [Actinobacteria bacterium]|nr:GTPase ObgE [Actinomycetota bacterium]MBU1944467.1 GTPase ObgE [Actinomycetota bacterium]MBU2688632.1 GTPase ObgE [Actinomycetota bacterium]